MKKSICLRLAADTKQIMECKQVVQELGNSFDSLTDILSLTGNSVRLKILYLLNRENELCVCDLSDILEMNISAISQHLRKLKDRNLISSRKKAQTIFYTLKKDQLHILQPFFQLLNCTRILEEMV